MDGEWNAGAAAPIRGALVTLPGQGDAGEAAGPRACPRPQAAFLAQLLANRDGTVAYRARRRAVPDAASARYGAGAAASSDPRFECVL